MIPPSWSLIVQLRAHSKSHSFAILQRGQLGQSQSILNDQTSVWQRWVSNCLIPVSLQNVLFPSLPDLFSQDRKTIHYSCLKSFSGQPGFSIAGALDRKRCWNPEILREWEESLIWKTFLKKGKRLSFLSMQKVDLMEPFAFWKGEMWFWAASESNWQ